MSVTVPPGATALTVIFLCPQSLAMTRTNESIAPFDPEYKECFGTLKSLAVLEDIRMIRPPSLRCRYASRATKNWPRVFRLNTRSNSSYFVGISFPIRLTSVLVSLTNLSHVTQVSEAHNSRIAAHDIKPAEMLHSIIHQLGGLRDLSNIGLEGNCI